MKKTLRPRSRAFTLIELLTVIAVIGILASILIPTVGAARKAANKAKTKAQFTGWANAIQNFKSTYGYYPTVFGNNGHLNLANDSADFIEALSGRDDSGDPSNNFGNRRAASFYSFAEGEFLYDDAAGDVSETQLADAFNNPNIKIYVDDDNDGEVDGLPDPDTGQGSGNSARVKVAIWSEEDDTQGFVGVYSWE